jgi:molybdenum cofactor cytidylyltransferase
MIGALILAAGCSSRAGTVNKLLYEISGKPLIVHVAQHLKHSRVDRIVAVTGYQWRQVEAQLVEAQLVESQLADTPISCCRNVDHASGLASSLTCGISALYDMDSIIVCLGDMPDVTADAIDQLISVSAATPDKLIFIPTWQGQRGNPLMFAKKFFDKLLALEGDAGARILSNQYPEDAVEVEVNCSGILKDYDTYEELQKLRNLKLPTY